MISPSSSAQHAIATIALDVGTQWVRSLRRDGLRLISRQQTSCYTVLPGDDATRDILRSAGVTYTACDDGLIVLGEAAHKVANSFGLPIIHAFANGAVPQNDVVGRQVLSLLVESVLPAACPGTPSLCVLSVSGADSVSEEFFAGLTRLRGYRPVLMRAATASGLTLLETAGLTGVAVDVGASFVEIATLTRGREVTVTTHHDGGRTLDGAFFDAEQHVTRDRFGNTYQNVELARESRERWASEAGESVSSSRLRPYRALCERIARAVVETFETAAVSHRFQRPTAIACSGGLLNDRVFEQRLRHAFARADTAQYFATTPTMIEDPFIVTRGLLIAAEVEALAFDRAA